MDENSEAHMDTDVSSTTEDVPECHEVSNSQGNVDMITVVVEEIKEEEAEDKTAKSQSIGDIVEAQIKNKSPQKVALTEQSVPETLTVEKPQQPVQISSILDTQKELPIPNTSLFNIPAEQPILPNQTEVVDSSTKNDSPKNDKNKSPVKSPIKISDVKSNPCKSPAKGQVPLVLEEEESLNNLNTENSNAEETQSIENTKQDENVKDKESSISVPVNITVERQTENDTNTETATDTTEKDHNKSISRELKSLINSAKESKIISECTQITSKIRKSRTPLENSNTSLNSSIEPEKIQVRRNSTNSLKSSCSEKSEKNTIKRSMRSQNPEFANKVKLFLNSVTGKSQKDDDCTDDDLDDGKSHDKEDSFLRVTISKPKKRKMDDSNSSQAKKLEYDPFCWRCHWAVEQGAEKNHPAMICTVCPRSFHFKCLSAAERSKINSNNKWVCPECLIILNAERSDTRSLTMKKIPLGMLCDLLKFALERMMENNGVDPFMSPVDREAFPDYDKYVIRPMDLSLMKSNITQGLYGSTEAFLADAQWILHNSIIFNTPQSKLTSGARALLRSCRAELSEIEACPECYSAAHARRPTWFTDVCSTPHILLWAKLKGFPYWPAKGMSVNPAGLVDVRFFGAHDRAWVPAKDCFLYSEKDPNNFRTKRLDILDSMQEAEQHIRNISRKYGQFIYPPFKTQFDPSKLLEQLKMLIPTFEGEIRIAVKDKATILSPSLSKDKSSPYPKSSKSSSVNDSDISEAEDQSISSSIRTYSSDRSKRDNSVMDEKDKAMDVQSLEIKELKECTPSRKRRRSELIEAVITILDTETPEKRKRPEDSHMSDKKSDRKETSNNKSAQEKSKTDTNKTKDVSKSDTKVKVSQEKQTTKDDELSNSTSAKDKILESEDKPERKRTVTPLKIKIQSNSKKHLVKRTRESPKSTTPIKKSFIIEKSSTSNEEKMTTLKHKSKKDKSLTEKNKDEHSKTNARRSKGNRSLSNNSSISDKSSGKPEKNGEVSNTKDKPKDDLVKPKSTEIDERDKSASPFSSTITKADTKFDDNNVVATNISGLPTISSVRSLSTTAHNTNPTNTATTTANNIEVTIEANPECSIFTPTSSENIRNVKDAADKLQKLRSDEPFIGKVGVRAFARMASPEKNANDGMEVQIKAEPIDLDDPERHNEKMDLMNAFKLRPVNPAMNLREVRINKVVVTPMTKRAPTASPEIRPKAKKSFPTPKKPEDTQLNGKNSMVYIPIQPPVTQAPVRPTRPAAVNGPVFNSPRAPALVTPTNCIVNTVTTPLASIMTSTPTSTTSVTATVQSIPTIGPTTVHTVPLMTSVNGQWMLSLQPVMSVGGVDSTPVQSTVNGLPERVTSVMQPTPSTIIRPATDVAAPGEPPRLLQRPPLLNPFDPNAPLANELLPPTAGPLTAKINQHAIKLADFFRLLLEDSLEKIDDPVSQVTSLKLQMEQCKWKYQREIAEIRQVNEMTMLEMRSTFEKEKIQAVNEAKRLAQLKLESAVKQAKSKQWCANCSQEAQFYCCWNTSYCDYPCQRAHWSKHFSVCTQHRPQDGNPGSSDDSNSPESRLLPQPNSLPALQKNSFTPAITVGGKLTTRPNAKEQPKTSLIINTVEDNTGNKVMKCIGTFSGNKKVSAPPLVLNKQLMNDEANKPGYWIMSGSNASNSTNVPQNRRVHTVQYLS